jgi:hypothetical protein
LAAYERKFRHAARLRLEAEEARLGSCQLMSATNGAFGLVRARPYSKLTTS